MKDMQVKIFVDQHFYSDDYDEEFETLEEFAKFCKDEWEENFTHHGFLKEVINNPDIEGREGIDIWRTL